MKNMLSKYFKFITILNVSIAIVSVIVMLLYYAGLFTPAHPNAGWFGLFFGVTGAMASNTEAKKYKTNI